MVSQFSSNDSQGFSQVEMDPFSAMKATLEAQGQEKKADIDSSPAGVSSATFDQSVQNLGYVPLNSVSIETPVSAQTQQGAVIENNQSSPLVSEVQNQEVVTTSSAQTLDLDTLTSMPIAGTLTNPLTAPVTYPQQVVSQPAKNMK